MVGNFLKSIVHIIMNLSYFIQLQTERGVIPEGASKHLPWGESLQIHTKPWVRSR